MSNDLIVWCLSFCSSLVFLIILTAANTSLASSTADVLIIRHGRSRVRHSTEKDHIRWGLKAFDNLTLDYSDFEVNANDTGDLLFPNSSSVETNMSESFLSTVQPAAPTALQSTATPSTVVTPTVGTTTSDERSSRTTMNNGKKKIGKRKIMADIKKNVDKGLAYLKAHFDLDDTGLSHYNSQHQIDSVNQPANGAAANNVRQQTAVDVLRNGDDDDDDDNDGDDKNRHNNNKKPSLNENSNGDKQNSHNNESQLNGKRQNRRTTKKEENLKSFKINLPFVKTTKQQKQDIHKQQQDIIHRQQQQQQVAEAKAQPVYISHFGENFRSHHEKDDKNLFPDYQSDFAFDITNGNDWTHPKTNTNNNENDNKKGPKINNSRRGSVDGDDSVQTKKVILNTAKAGDKDKMRPLDDDKMFAYAANGTNDKIMSDTEDRRRVDLVPEVGHTQGHSNHSHHKVSHTGRGMINAISSFVAHDTNLYASDYEIDKDVVAIAGGDDSGSSSSAETLENVDDQLLTASEDDYVNNAPSVNTIDLNYMDDENGEDGEVGEGIDETTKVVANIYQMADVDLSGFDETTRNNRRNLMRGRDLVTKFLQIVESQHLLGANCSAGTELNLGEGVVDHYAQDRFRVEAEVAVNRANMLTRIFKLTSPEVQLSEELLHASVLSMIEFDDDIFAAGNCFDWNQHPAKPGLFCPFAYRLPAPDQGVILVKDLAAEYHYLGNKSEWFFVPRKNAEKVVMRNEQYIRSYHIYLNSTQREKDETLSVKYEDGRWSKPYYDCGGGNIWMLTYTVPFFGYENGTYFFKGTSGIDIDLRRVDIDQCPQRNLPVGTRQPLNIFAGTDKCKPRTTECSPSPGLGFRRGSYRCICRRGYYFPDTTIEQKYFNGSTLEEEYEKLMLGEDSFYNHEDAYECLPCAEGCDTCEDASPCVAELNWPMRTSVLILACAVIGFLPPAAWFTHKYQQVKVVRAASPALLRVIALGAFFIYCTSLVMYPNPSLYTCTARVWLREIGFSLTYGALMLKTWRISVIFRVRSAKAVKITDASLLKRLGILCGFVGVALLVRTLVAPPVVIVGRTADNLKAFLCKTDWWDHTFTSMEVLFLAWGVRLCIMVRKAPSEFNESRFISMAIYNEFLLTCFLNVSMLFLQSPANPDLLYIIFFCHTQLTVTLLLALIFGSKVYLVFRGGGKPHEEPMKSSGAKFISRSQPRAFANASSITTSTAQMGAHVGNDTRLTEQEATEEIKQICDQLKRLYDRIPSRGSAQGTIQTLIDSCKMATHNGQQQQLTLKPPASVSPKPSGGHADKSTNTTDNCPATNGYAIGNGTTINHLCAKIMITDESDKQLQHCNSNLTCSSTNNSNINLVVADLTKSGHKSNEDDAVTKCNGNVRPPPTYLIDGGCGGGDDIDRPRCCCCCRRCGCRALGTTTTTADTTGGGRASGCECKNSKKIDQTTGCEYNNRIPCIVTTCTTTNRTNNNNNSYSGCPAAAVPQQDTIDDSTSSSIGGGESNLNLAELEFECMCSSSCDEDAYNDFKDNCDIALDPRELRSALSDLRKSQNLNSATAKFTASWYSSDLRTRAGEGGGTQKRTAQPNFESCDNIYSDNSAYYQRLGNPLHPLNRHLSSSNVEATNKANLRPSKSEDSNLLLGDRQPATSDAQLSNQIIDKNLRDHKSEDQLEATPPGRRKKSPEKRLVIDLNDRSKYTEEVSV